jgi:hypothetical protein
MAWLKRFNTQSPHLTDQNPRFIFYSSHPLEGVLMRRYDGGVGCGARGLKGNVPLGARAAPGLRPGTLGSPARSSLTAGREACPRLVVPLAPARGHAREPRQGETAGQKARPGAGKTPLMERREAPASFKRGCGKTERLVRRSVLHPLDLSRGTTRPASRGRLFECWISGRPDIQSGRTRRPYKEYGRARAPFWQRIRAMAQRLLGPRFRGDDRGETIADPRINANREP